MTATKPPADLVDLSDLAGPTESEADLEVRKFLTPHASVDSNYSRPVAVLLSGTEFDGRCRHPFTSPTYGQETAMLKRYNKEKKLWLYEPVGIGTYLNVPHRIETSRREIEICHLCFPLDISQFE
jgi:hypothetical protein